MEARFVCAIAWCAQCHCTKITVPANWSWFCSAGGKLQTLHFKKTNASFLFLSYDAAIFCV